MSLSHESLAREALAGHDWFLKQTGERCVCSTCALARAYLEASERIGRMEAELRGLREKASEYVDFRASVVRLRLAQGQLSRSEFGTPEGEAASAESLAARDALDDLIEMDLCSALSTPPLPTSEPLP